MRKKSCGCSEQHVSKPISLNKTNQDHPSFTLVKISALYPQVLLPFQGLSLLALSLTPCSEESPSCPRYSVTPKSRFQGDDLYEVSFSCKTDVKGLGGLGYCSGKRASFGKLYSPTGPHTLEAGTPSHLRAECVFSLNGLQAALRQL